MRAWLRKTAARFQGENGVTLMEVVIAVGLISIAGAMVGAPMFSVIQANEGWRQDLSATANWRQAAGHLSRDVGNAVSISLGNGSPSTDSVSMTWVSDTTHTVDYALFDGVLLRTDNGAGLGVARRVSSVEFTRNGNLLTMELTMIDKDEPVLAHAALRSLAE